MSQELEVVPTDDQTTIPITDVQAKIDAMVANRAYLVEKIKPLFIEGVDYYTVPGTDKKPSLGKPGAEKLATLYSLTAKFEIDRETMDVLGPDIKGKKYLVYICNLSSKGRIAGQGRGAKIIEMERTSYKMIFDNQYSLLTNEEKSRCQGPLTGTSKQGNKYTYYRQPAEPINDPLAINTAIKMAQKSAFVDAVIRATGVSDLFTQDLEDGGNTDDAGSKEPKEKPTDEPFKGTPSYSKPTQPQPSDLGMKCPACKDGYMKKRNAGRGDFYGCSNYPDCRHSLTPEAYAAAQKS